MQTLKTLVGAGDRIALFIVPFIILAGVLAVAEPVSLHVGGPPTWLRNLSVAILAVGLVVWLWSVVLIVANVPKGRLITSGPYAWVTHPLYTAVALLVLPWVGFLLDTWLGVLLGAALYVGSRIFAREEEATLSRAFGEQWRDYRRHVRLGWL
jgi:protein-S-isoprenylcysteine O-methyltransferase Ste14